MRSGGYTLQETLTAECASILKHSLGLARRRNNAQITPLHVASTLLCLNVSSLRTACLKSSQQQNNNNNHSIHQCRALELCFNVALNRLPTITITTSPFLQQHQHVPSLSNSLIAALKRAQAHQRRGCIEQNQNHQPLLCVKVEIHQLILSILDDPSVSRVMREAGFSSTCVKNNLQSQNQSSGTSGLTNHNHFLSSYGFGYGYGYGSVMFSPPQKKHHHLPLQTCKEDMKVPTLENQWCLQDIPIPCDGDGLGLSLHSSSVHDSNMSISQYPSPILESKLFTNKEEHDKLNYCEECSINYEKEAQLLKPSQKNLLPAWLQSHNTQAHQKDELTQLKKKWIRLCQCLHQNKQPQNHWNNPYNSSYPYWRNQGSILPDSSSSISFADSGTKPAYYSSNTRPRFRRQQSCTIEFNFNDKKTQKNQTTTTTLDSLKGIESTKEIVKTALALGNSTFNDSDKKYVENSTLQRDHICKVLQENVPWQYETVSSIAEVLVDSKSSKERATWLFLQGNDSVGKKRLALAIAESVFGSVNVLFQLDMLKRENSDTLFPKMVVGPLKNHEKFVFLVENVDFGDTLLRKLFEDEIGVAKFGSLGQKIFILTNGGTVISEDQKKEDSVMKLVLKISESVNISTLELSSSSKSPCLGNKRMAELDFFSRMKNPRIEENEGNRKREFSFSRQLSFNNTLDLNMKADGYDNDEEENSPISSDLTREIGGEQLIENLFELNQSLAKKKEMKDMFMSRVKESFEEVLGKVKFSVQDKVIEEIGVGGIGSFTNNMFEKWLKDIFQTSLERVNGGGKNGIVFTLCWGGKEDRKRDNGFMGSCLPKNIQIVNYLMD